MIVIYYETRPGVGWVEKKAWMVLFAVTKKIERDFIRGITWTTMESMLLRFESDTIFRPSTALRCELESRMNNGKAFADSEIFCFRSLLRQ